jgi:hypothetical protein
MSEAEQPNVERRYTNYLRVAFNQSEFLLDFSQLYDVMTEMTHTQLVASPTHTKQFVELMQRCIADYEQKYGSIDIPRDH